MVLSSNQTKKSLLKKGFKIDNTHHHYYIYFYEGKIVTRTKLSHNDQDINDHLISKMRKQCQISKSEFINLITCPLDERGYVEILKRQGIIK